MSTAQYRKAGEFLLAQQERQFDRREMEAVHTLLRREARQLPTLIRAADSAERAEILAEHFTVVAETLHHHHRAEDDFVWPLLAERGGETVEEQLRTMDAQHGALAVLLDRVRAGFHRWTTGDGGGSALADDVARLAEVLDEHLVAEEELVVPVMERHITADEWDEMVRKGASAADPATLPLAFGMLMYEGDAEVVEHAIASVPAHVRPTLRGLAADAFAQHARRVYGTATPPRSTEVAAGGES